MSNENEFQSTLPSQGATTFRPVNQPVKLISIHAPLTGSDVGAVNGVTDSQNISIHAPLTGSDG